MESLIDHIDQGQEVMHIGVRSTLTASRHHRHIITEQSRKSLQDQATVGPHLNCKLWQEQGHSTLRPDPMCLEMTTSDFIPLQQSSENI